MDQHRFHRSFSSKEGIENMFCKKCPHHVRHGTLAADKKNIEFTDRCGLRMKSGQADLCDKYPFAAGFNFVECNIYRDTFKSAGQRNDCIPTSDFLYADNMSGTPITEMELL
jgi:hypothetical protein